MPYYAMNTFFPYYSQFDSMDCGPTSLRMIAKYYELFVLALLLLAKEYRCLALAMLRKL